MRARSLFALAVLASAVFFVACGSGSSQSGTLREYELTAEVVDWEVVDGELVEVWGYNGEYPGPMIEAEVGDTVRVTLHNNLPEGTTIHWHGLEVPNDQDGVPGITQPMVEPGQTWVYEFVVDKPGTTMYHTHANTVRQLTKGLVGPFVVREKGVKQSPRYDHDYTLVLHEIDGLFTINGHSFPATLDDPDSLISLETGDRVLVRMINAGQQHHPMHMHGHQFKVVAFDGNTLADPYLANTVDIAPGQTVDVEVIGNNPGTWTFHCHILPHVTNRGQYPGGMLTLVDYTDHQSMLEGAPAPQQPGTSNQGTTTTTVAAGPIEVDREVEVVATDFAFDPGDLELVAGETVRLILRNEGVLPHNIEIPEVSAFVEAEAGSTAETVFVVPPAGRYTFWCAIAGHREAGMEGELIAQ